MLSSGRRRLYGAGPSGVDTSSILLFFAELLPSSALRQPGPDGVDTVGLFSVELLPSRDLQHLCLLGVDSAR